MSEVYAPLAYDPSKLERFYRTATHRQNLPKEMRPDRGSVNLPAFTDSIIGSYDHFIEQQLRTEENSTDPELKRDIQHRYDVEKARIAMCLLWLQSKGDENYQQVRTLGETVIVLKDVDLDKFVREVASGGANHMPYNIDVDGDISPTAQLQKPEKPLRRSEQRKLREKAIELQQLEAKESTAPPEVLAQYGMPLNTIRDLVIDQKLDQDTAAGIALFFGFIRTRASMETQLKVLRVARCELYRLLKDSKENTLFPEIDREYGRYAIGAEYLERRVGNPFGRETGDSQNTLVREVVARHGAEISYDNVLLHLNTHVGFVLDTYYRNRPKFSSER
jgi:hypothetical protein